MERAGTEDLTGGADRDLQPMLKAQLCPGNILVNFEVEENTGEISGGGCDD